MWSRGIWVARAAGILLVIIGVFVSAGMLPSLVSSSSAPSMVDVEDNAGNGGMTMTGMMINDNSINNNNSNKNVVMDGSTS
jgi:hypothetical protein